MGAQEPKVSIVSQIAEVKRELALRTNAYPRFVATGKMRQGEAELCLSRMNAVLETLMWCQANEAEIRAYISQRRKADGRL